MVQKGLKMRENARFNKVRKVQECSKKFKKVQEGSRRFKKVQESSIYLKKDHEGSRGFSEGFKMVQEVS